LALTTPSLLAPNLSMSRAIPRLPPSIPSCRVIGQTFLYFSLCGWHPWQLAIGPCLKLWCNWQAVSSRGPASMPVCSICD
jgi:hypothetical protein